jgi:hypothetical protein
MAALPALSNFNFGVDQLRLDYADGRQYFLNYKDIVAVQIDPTTGIYVVRIYPSGEVGSSISVSNPDLIARGTTYTAFVSTLNSYL